jgi:hypothetical protein
MRVVLCALLLAGCAASPKSIEPIAYADPALVAAPCEQIVGRLAAAEDALLRLVKVQGERHARDGALLIGLGVSSTMTNQDETNARVAEIGRLKGESQTLRGAATAKGCAAPEQNSILKRTT